MLPDFQDILEIKPGETTPDGLFTLKETECLGSCGTGPVMQVNSEFHEKLTPLKVNKLIEDLRDNANNKKPDGSTWVEKFC